MLSSLKVKLTPDQVQKILNHFETILGTIKIKDLFPNDRFTIPKNVSEDVRVYLYAYFNNYTYGEFMEWLKANVDYVNDKVGYTLPICAKVQNIITTETRELFNSIFRVKKVPTTIRINFNKTDKACAVSKTIFEDLQIKSNMYGITSDPHPQTIQLTISIDDVSIKFTTDQKGLSLISATGIDYEFFYDDYQTPNAERYLNKVIKNRQDNFVHIMRSAVTQKNADTQNTVKYMIAAILFACHFPVTIPDKKNGTLPIYTISSISSETADKQVCPLPVPQDFVLV